ncbi:hypothetical protein PIIN_03098 [Serendipita indica DSM 11827]|uniref:Uncharacterized protein n=1 Tax=Serendipita indica (strain DSM 11827) TaxID=1109443 RepID=G4TD00_SERID|nr:hypothetical protein PIIN_03098 [Serendipita indica DSM 11827]
MRYGLCSIDVLDAHNANAAANTRKPRLGCKAKVSSSRTTPTVFGLYSIKNKKITLSSNSSLSTFRTTSKRNLQGGALHPQSRHSRRWTRKKILKPPSTWILECCSEDPFPSHAPPKPAILSRTSSKLVTTLGSYPSFRCRQEWQY